MPEFFSSRTKGACFLSTGVPPACRRFVTKLVLEGVFIINGNGKGNATIKGKLGLPRLTPIIGITRGNSTATTATSTTTIVTIRTVSGASAAPSVES